MTIDELKDKLEKLKKDKEVCPHCGRCPYCGRRYDDYKYSSWPYPYRRHNISW